MQQIISRVLVHGFSLVMKRNPIRCFLCSALALCVVLLTGTVAHAQSTSTTGSLTVSMTVQSSISLVFLQSSSAGTQGTCSITGANTSTATLNFGIASIAGDNQSCVSFAANSKNSYTLSNNIYYEVTESNTSSGSYSVTASLPSSPVSGVTWAASSQALSSSPVSITSNASYGSQQAVYLQVTVLSTVTTSNLSQSINFTATAN